MTRESGRDSSSDEGGAREPGGTAPRKIVLVFDYFHMQNAAWALDESPEDVPLAVSEAKSFGCLALTQAGIEGIQLHGAVGYTAEYDVQLYLKRSKWSRPLFGDEDWHHDRIAQLSGY